MFIYQSTNPCICGSPSTSDPDPGCPDNCNCLHLCNITINALDEDAVPCGDTGSKDLLSEDYDHDTCACGDVDITLSVEWFDDTILSEVSISGSTLSWIPIAEDFPPQYGNVIIKGSCGAIAAYFTVTIGQVDICVDADCESDEECNQCDGCTAIVPDAVLT